MIKKYTTCLFTLLISLVLLQTTFAQQDVFSRGDVSTGNFGDGELPWFYATSNNSQGDPDNGNTTRNYVKIGHNNNTTMTTNGRFYQFTSLDFQSSATSARTINNSGGGLSASGGIYNASAATHTFNTPIGIDGSTVQIHVNSSGSFVFNQNIFINSNTVEFGNLGTGNITVNGTMEGTGNMKKIGTNTLIITGTHTYTGTTSIEGGLLILQTSLANSDITVKSGATLEIEGDVIVKSLLVETGGNVVVNAGKSLTVSNNLTATGDVTFNSNSQSYSSLIANSVTGTVTYKRFVNNAAGSGTSTTANDLVSPPVAGMTFGDLRMAADTNILSGMVSGNGPFYLFGPFDNSSTNNYVLFEETVDDGIILDSGVGYRTGSADTDGGIYTFTGTVETDDVPKTITTPSGGNQWNLIGNPYPSYITLSGFLSMNNGKFDTNAAGVYGYDGAASDGWIVWNSLYSLLNPNALIAPGQGFFVASGSASEVVNFDSDIRSIGASDDFIPLRSTSAISTVKLNLASATNSYDTEVYFTEFSTLGLDPGFDASLFGGTIPDFSVYSNLVEENNGIPFGIQAVGETDYNDVIIPLGVTANISEQITFSISNSTIPSTVEVYLDDTVASTSTLLTNSDYVLTPSSYLSGVGRFYLRFIDNSLSTAQNSFDSLDIFMASKSKEIIVNGQLSENTNCALYDIQGRLISTIALDDTILQNRIDVSNVTTGIYVIKLSNNDSKLSKKIIIK
ncbi:T9SS type A sorting domain-containing protein [Psychroserpens sp. AS72]|uniref:T9SS type A sorting domain-containing protein n=1 Tax=Psychroserpens sp. AS72 TaxID=3135775 RepID=UPI00316D1B3B